MLLRAAVKVRQMKNAPRRRWNDALYPVHRDRLIAATLAATPLLMPFYFDYDLLLLAIPATLFVAELLRREAPLTKLDRWTIAGWATLYAWQMVNTDVAEKTHLNLSVPLLCTLASLLILRVGRSERSIERHDEERRTIEWPKAA